MTIESVLAYIVGAVVSVLVLYGIIRLAVTHAIVAARSLPRASKTSEVRPQEGRPAVWWEQPPAS
jgi:hypothetical protein